MGYYLTVHVHRQATIILGIITFGTHKINDQRDNSIIDLCLGPQFPEMNFDSDHILHNLVTMLDTL